MPMKIVIMGSMATKGEQMQFHKGQLAGSSFEPIMMDLSMGGAIKHSGGHYFRRDLPVGGQGSAGAHRFQRQGFCDEHNEHRCAAKSPGFFSQNRLHSIVSPGGSTMAFMGSKIMAQLPFGLFKDIATAAATSIYVATCFRATDLIARQMIMEVARMNDLIKNAITQVAGVITGMVAKASDFNSLRLPHPSIAVTEVGFSDQCAKHVEALLAKNDDDYSKKGKN